MAQEWIIPGVEKKTANSPNITILLAVGSINLRQAIKNMFRAMGDFKVHEAGTGEKALRILKDEKENDKDYFVIFDLDLPGDTPGINVAREIRSTKRLENLALVLLAADASRDNVALIAELEVSGCLVKPFGLGALEKKFLQITRERSNPPEHIKMIYRGEKLLSESNHKDALDIFLASQQIKNSARVNVHIGEAFEKLSRFDMAHSHYDKAIDANDKYVRAYSFAATLYMKLSKNNLALPYLEEATRLSPFNAFRQYSLGGIYLNGGDEPGAYGAFERAVKINPGFSMEIAEKFLDYGNSESAEFFFRKSLAVERNKVDVFNRLGIALRRQGKWQEAVNIYKKVVRIDSNNAGIYFNMGRSYFAGEMLEQAATCFKNALRLDPSLLEADNELKKIEKMAKTKNN